jgi:hypothetical protein
LGDASFVNILLIDCYKISEGIVSKSGKYHGTTIDFLKN